jgi:hypothetical protein
MLVTPKLVMSLKVLFEGISLGMLLKKEVFIRIHVVITYYPNVTACRIDFFCWPLIACCSPRTVVFRFLISVEPYGLNRFTENKRVFFVQK